MAAGLGTQEKPTLSWVDSPCHLLLLSTSRSHSSLCKSSPRPPSIRRVPACLLRRSRSERWQCPGLWDLALGRNNTESESVCGWSQPATRTQSEHGCWCRASRDLATGQWWWQRSLKAAQLPFQSNQMRSSSFQTVKEPSFCSGHF